ncbi:glycosyltransferase [Streptomyces canus]|uniref:glycosyltransferase n=1 Tax=Streptomyces canus TaxID=58343 RepID=UPI00224E1391|nr:glycosyltransferase [Streptomyces canus]MCX4852242.1 glycosyltransferase [Streptomyces canus]
MSNHPVEPILFVSISARGHLNPLLTIAGELAARGRHGLCFAADDDARSEIEALTGESEVEFVSLGPQARTLNPTLWDDEAYKAATTQSKWKNWVALMREALDVNTLTEKYLVLDAEVERLKPALMVVDSETVYAVDVAMTRGIPFVLSVPYPVSGFFLPLLPKDYPTPLSGLSQRMTRAQRLTNRLLRLRFLTLPLQKGMPKKLMAYMKVRKQLGIANPTGSVAAKIDEATAVFAYSVFGVEYPFPAPEKLQMLGAVVPSTPRFETHSLTRWLDEQESVVHMGFGTISRLSVQQVASLVEVARRLNGRQSVLWKLPKAQQDLLPSDGEMPPNLRIEAWIPSQPEVLAHPRVRAFVTHGGGNSVGECLFFGKPLVVAPLWLDCHDLAARVADCGAGLVVTDTRTFDADEVTAQLTRVLNEDSFHERARHWAARQRAAGGVGRAADLIVGYADRLGAG